MIKASLKFGTTAIQVEAENVKDLVKEISFFSELPTCCGNCGGKDISFRHRFTSGYDFYEIICGSPQCGYTFGLGQPKDDKDRLFPKHAEGWKAPYQKTSND